VPCNKGFEASQKFCGLCGQPTVDVTGTPYETRLAILGEIFVEYSEDENFTDFRRYNDLGLPLAYAITSGIVASTQRAENLVNETWNMLLTGLDIEMDQGYEDIYELLNE
jgi:hypothetical protein